MDKTNPGFKFSNLFDLNNTSSRFYHQTYLALGLGLHPSEMMEVMEDREVWRLNLKLLPQQTSRKSEQWRKKKNKIFSC